MAGWGTTETAAAAITRGGMRPVDIEHRSVAFEDLRPLARMPQLKAATFALGSLRKNEAAEALLGLKPAEGFKSDWREI